MIICAFTDLHADRKSFIQVKKKAEKADLIICTGDMSIFGRGLEAVGLLLEQFNKKVLLVPGNHELEEEIAVISSKNLLNMHKMVYTHKGITFLGHGGGGFTRTIPDFAPFVKTIKEKTKIDVMLVHQPPYGTKLDKLDIYGHVGNKDYTNFIEKVQPTIVFCGHLHENFHKSDTIKKTLIVNPGPDGELYEIKEGKAKHLPS
jgi:Icc-related predicted phosphoesterase